MNHQAKPNQQPNIELFIQIICVSVVSVWIICILSVCVSLFYDNITFVLSLLPLNNSYKTIERIEYEEDVEFCFKLKRSKKKRIFWLTIDIVVFPLCMFVFVFFWKYIWIQTAYFILFICIYWWTYMNEYFVKASSFFLFFCGRFFIFFSYMFLLKYIVENCLCKCSLWEYYKMQMKILWISVWWKYFENRMYVFILCLCLPVCLSILPANETNPYYDGAFVCMLFFLFCMYVCIYVYTVRMLLFSFLFVVLQFGACT